MSRKKTSLGNRFKYSKYVLLAVFFLATIPFHGCRTSKPSLQEGTTISENIKYTKYNIHIYTQRPRKAHYASYFETGNFIPAGSKVYFPGKGHPWRKGFWFTVLDTGQDVFFEFYRDRMGMTELEYYNLITSDTPISINKFSEIDRKGVEDGKVYIGMSKEGVLISLGYPAKHKTPSLESNTWIYWRNRATTLAVEFDEMGKVNAIK